MAARGVRRSDGKLAANSAYLLRDSHSVPGSLAFCESPGSLYVISMQRRVRQRMSESRIDIRHWSAGSISVRHLLAPEPSRHRLG